MICAPAGKKEGHYNFQMHSNRIPERFELCIRFFPPFMHVACDRSTSRMHACKILANYRTAGSSNRYAQARN